MCSSSYFQPASKRSLPPIAAALGATYDFSRHRRLLDVQVRFFLPCCGNTPRLEGTLFELPGACAVARQRIFSRVGESEDRYRGRRLFKAPLPGDHDVLLLANIVHVLSASQNLELMRRARATVQATARLLLVDLWTDSTHSQPPAAALMSGQFLLMGGEGQTYSEQEADEWLGQTGWRKLERKPLRDPASLIVAEAI